MIRFKPHDAPRKPRTAAQEAQQDRAWRICRLRGLWYLVYVLSPNRRRIAQVLIDQDLEQFGAEAETFRRQESDRLAELAHRQDRLDSERPF